jgi:hypothetical protein
MTTFTITICTNEEHLMLGLPCWTGMINAREQVTERAVSIFKQAQPEEELVLETDNSWNKWNGGYFSRKNVSVRQGYRCDNVVIESSYDCEPVPKHLQELALTMSIGMSATADKVGSGL